MSVKDSVSKDQLRLWLHMLSATRRIESELRDRFRREFDTTLPRFDVMAALARHSDGLRMSEISGVLRVSNGNVTVVIQRLVEDRLVQRIPVPGDRRATMAALTDQGRAEFDKQAEAHEQWISELFATLPSNEIPELDATMQRLSAKPAHAIAKDTPHD